MSKHSKRFNSIKEKIDTGKVYSPEEAFGLLKEYSSVKFDESVDIVVKLGVDPRKSDQMVRGASNLPNGSGKVVRVAVFAQGDKAEEAKQAGADLVGFDDLVENIQKSKGNIDFDVVVATPDSMVAVGKVGKLLGPKGLMPNPKSGTVTDDLESAIKSIKKGQATFRTDKAGIIHCKIGAVSFEVNHLLENMNAVLSDIKRLKPTSAKGIYIQKITVSTTMGPGLTLDKASVVV